jgi:hypothetical protein
MRATLFLHEPGFDRIYFEMWIRFLRELFGYFSGAPEASLNKSRTNPERIRMNFFKKNHSKKINLSEL